MNPTVTAMTGGHVLVAGAGVAGRGAARLLAEKLESQGLAIETYVSTLNTDPWDFTVSTGVATGHDAHSASTAAAPAWEL